MKKSSHEAGEQEMPLELKVLVFKCCVSSLIGEFKGMLKLQPHCIST